MSSLENAFEGLHVHLAVPDLWQQEAIRAVREGEDVIVGAPTGAGKTFIFESLVNGGKFPPQGQQAVYTVPTRALANDKWHQWKREGWKVGIATGDIAENLDAPVLVATLETQRERFLAGDGPFLLVIDEYQMIGDRQRGLSYELAVALAPPTTRLLLMSGSVGNPGAVRDWLTRLGRNVRVVETDHRPVPLDEIPVEALPRTAPDRYRNFWHRLALGTLLSNYGPLLIFATHRKSAEKIAKRVAEVLPADDPISFGDKKLEQACSSDLAKLLQKRIAFHHSGLGFAERSAIVEPLAKAGQLRVVVATMGLASGINFSVRSVFIADTTYQDGPFLRDVSPDELLQMFGRAGRRGLDEVGYVVCGRQSPRLGDARPLELRRKNEIDWPTLLRRMSFAADRGESPFAAARETRDRLFSEQRIPLGFTSGVGGGSDSEDGPLFNLKPTRKEILASTGEWEAVQSGREDTVPLGEAISHIRGRYRPAEGDSQLISALLPDRARLCRLSAARGSRRYGLELAVATETEAGRFSLTKFARKLAGQKKRDDDFSRSEIEELLPDLFRETIEPAEFEDFVQRGRTLYLTGHFQNVPLPVYRDSTGKPIHEPLRRSVEIESETHFTEEVSGETFQPVAGSPAYAWRKLGLIDDAGRPTTRGRIFSLFQGGEGLAVAAALEDPNYPADEIVLHLANLRAGHRFELDSVPDVENLVDSVGSERLAAACRQAYGPVDHEGYLSLGLPPAYGEGAAEVVGMMLHGKLHKLLAHSIHLDFGPGDAERAFIEWLSLLRHIRHAPDLESERWTELKAAATAELKRRDRRSPLSDLPDLPASVLQKSPQHGLPYHALR